MNFLTSRFASFKYGALLPIDAAKLILRNKTLIFWSLLPIILTTVLYVYGIQQLIEVIKVYVTGLFTGFGLDPEGFLMSVVNVFTWIMLLLVSALTFAFVSNVVASPFNDYLAEKTEPHCKPALPAISPENKVSQWTTILIDLAKTGAAMMAAIAALIFAIIPGLNIVVSVFWLLLVCFQYTSYPQTRRGVKLKDGTKFLWKHLYACTGFGMSISFLFSLPFISSLALPLAVVGGTLIVGRAPGDRSQPELK